MSIGLAITLLLSVGAYGTFATAQLGSGFDEPAAIRAAMEKALLQGREAERRVARLEAKARAATESLDKISALTAALAARIQQSEAGIAAAEARLELIGAERAQLDRKLSDRRQPVIRLTGALQKMARRPIALSALKPGSLRETVYLRAVLESTVPQIRDRTAALRVEVRRERALEREAAQALTQLRDSESALQQRRKRLVALETRQRLAARQVGGQAAREKERALAMAEEVRDLDTFLGELGEAGDLREELSALPGPVLRPRSNRQIPIVPQMETSKSAPPAISLRFQLPVTGRIVTGFGARSQGGVASDGIVVVPVDGAQIVAPARGRVAFAGAYRGYDRIVIIEHIDGWTSLVTGLARTDVAVGELVGRGAPIGTAKVGSPRIALELRQDGGPVNPLEYVD